MIINNYYCETSMFYKAVQNPSCRFRKKLNRKKIVACQRQCTHGHPDPDH
jgi:hypothetical protein